MTEVLGYLPVVEAVRRDARDMALEVAHGVSGAGDPALPPTAGDWAEILRLARWTIDETLAAADPGVPPRPDEQFRGLHPELPHDVSETVCRTAFDRTWSRLIEYANGPERDQLLHVAADVFGHAQRLRNAVSKAPEPTAADRDDVEEAVVRALLQGEGADQLAERYRIKLTTSYAVALLRPDPPADWLVRDRLGVDGTGVDGTGVDGAGVNRAGIGRAGVDQPGSDRPGILTARREGCTLALLPGPLPIQAEELPFFVENLLGGAVHPGVTRVAMSSARTRDHLATAVDEATTVHRVALALDFPAGVYQLADVPVEAALTRSPDLALLLARRLAPLNASGASLLNTLRTYQEQGQDRRLTARALHIHPNTLDYRLRRIRELTGLSPAVHRDVQMLGAAVTAWRLLHQNLASPNDLVVGLR